MRVAVCILVALALLACGSGSERAADQSRSEAALAESQNHAPEIVSVELFPEEPTVDQTISVAIEVRDPERDALDVTVEWWRNGLPFRRGPETHLAGKELERGDEIYALVTASDGEYEVSAESPSVTVHNQAPRLTSLQLLPAEPTGADNMMAVATAADAEGDDISFEYRWFRNDRPIAGVSGPALKASHVQRGAEIRVEVQARDDLSSSNWIASEPVQVKNAPPVITSEPSYDVKLPGRYEYEVAAEDPDGDVPLRFELVEAPRGMKVDLLSGVVSWDVPSNAAGQYTIEVNVHDAHGGLARQRYAIDLRWEQPAAAPAPVDASDRRGSTQSSAAVEDDDPYEGAAGNP